LDQRQRGEIHQSALQDRVDSSGDVVEEVRTQGNVLGSDKLDRVRHMIDVVSKFRFVVQERPEGVDPDEPARRGDCTNLLVGQVARMVMYCAARGMRCDEWSPRDLGDVPETGQ